jgi:aryl-phospho-beta-D-glucosidase BglC (GH1 family)
MKKGFMILLMLSVLVSTIIVFGIVNINAASAVAEHGQLKVDGGQLCNSKGKPVVLRGMSSHGLQWYGDYMNDSTIEWLRDDWNVNVVRAANYTEENGYISRSSTMKSKVVDTIDGCIEAGIYGIIDWHILSDGNPNTHVKEAKDFFKEMAKKYSGSPNVIYEICNEPNGVNWNIIKKYANEVIPVIRKEDPDSVIIVGTPNWSQDVDVASSSPLKYDNILLALHFYSGTHGEWLMDKAKKALDNGSALFASEWGTSDATGDGGPFLNEANEWLDFFDDHGISWCNWSLCDKDESSAALKSSADKKGDWSESQLTESGKFVRKELRERNGKESTDTSKKLAVKEIPAKNDIYQKDEPISIEEPVDTDVTYVAEQPVEDTVEENPFGTPWQRWKNPWQNPDEPQDEPNDEPQRTKEPQRTEEPQRTKDPQRTKEPQRTEKPQKTTKVEIDPAAKNNGRTTFYYTTTNDWGNGGTVQIVIVNGTNKDIKDWTMQMEFTGDQKVTNIWNGTYNQSGKVLEINGKGEADVIPAHGEVTVGFTISYSGINRMPRYIFIL